MGRAMGLEASGMLVGISEDELGGPYSSMGCRAQPWGHHWVAGASLPSPVRVLLPRCPSSRGDEPAQPQVPPSAAWLVLSPLWMSAPCPISQTEKAPIPCTIPAERYRHGNAHSPVPAARQSGGHF